MDIHILCKITNLKMIYIGIILHHISNNFNKYYSHLYFIKYTLNYIQYKIPNYLLKYTNCNLRNLKIIYKVYTFITILALLSYLI